MEQIFQDRVALVTGSARGIGLTVSDRLAKDGARVVIADLDYAQAQAVAEKMKTKGRKAVARKVDVRDKGQVQRMFQEIRSSYGKVDILVNNAGIRIDSPLSRISMEEWDLMMATQLKGAFFCCREAIKDMMNNNYGKIVNISSPVPSALGIGKQVGYASTSAGLEGFTRALSLELGRYNINVNCVSPEFIETEMTRTLARDEGMYLDDFRRFAAALVPLRRLGTPEEVASVVCFLASDEASFVSGQVIYVKGGA